MNGLVHTALMAAVALTAGCAAPTKSLFPPAAGEPVHTVHVVNHGGHTGLVIARADLPADWPALEDFLRARFLEFGWGDAGYYPAERPGLWVAAKAVCWPTPSVLHVAAIPDDIREEFPDNDIVAVELSEAGFERLRDRLRHTFHLAEGRPVAAARGLYGNGKFYRARGKFYFPRTCNYWSASALRAAGCPVTPARACTAGGVMAQVKKIGRSLPRGRRRRPWRRG